MKYASMMLRFGWIAVGLFGVACAGNVVDRSRDMDPSAGGRSGTGGAVSPGGVSAKGSGGGGVIFVPPPATGGASAMACAGVTSTDPGFASVVVLFLVDRSAHWGDGDASGLWPAVVNAISTLVVEPYAAEAQIALGYFPGDPGDASACNADFTLAVPFQRGKDAALAIRTSLEQTRGAGPRALGQSLASALEYARSNAMPELAPHVVVVTGGAGECAPRDLTSITAAYPGVTASVLGVGQGLSTQSELTAPFATAEFVETADEPLLFRKFAQESGLAQACTIRIPPPPQGKTFDTDLVDVRLQPPGGIAESLYYVNDESECAVWPDKAWHYDSAAAPTSIVLCDGACARTPGAGLTVIYGCGHPGPTMR
jgi:hypothetical protein